MANEFLLGMSDAERKFFEAGGEVTDVNGYQEYVVRSSRTDSGEPAPPDVVCDAKIKSAAEKVPLYAIAFRALKGVARVFGYGRKKYAAGNYINGTDDGAPERYMGGALRHLAACQGRGGVYNWESIAARDVESGLYELDHAICGLIMLRDIAIERGAMAEDPGIGNEPESRL
jgi:hypothetical protein